METQRKGPKSWLGAQGEPRNPVPPSEAVLTLEAPNLSEPPPSLSPHPPCM